MQNSAQEFCSFCLKSRNEVDIIDTTKNSLLIDNKCYEFSYIFNDLLQFTSSDECICEMCKDLMVSFYLFKRNIKFPHNHIFRMLIKTQIEEFLNSFADNIEDIRVIRTVNSISLQFDKDEIHQNNVKIESKSNSIEDEQVNEETNDEMGYETLINYHCSKCDKIESTENDSEIHEFLKHSSFGVQLEIEIENSKVYSESSGIEDIFYVCGFCTSHLESFDLLLLHLLNVHNPELLFQINETLNIPSHLIEFATINGYLNYIKECLHHGMTNSIDYEQKKYFFEVYGETDEISNSSEKDIQEEEIEISEMNETMTNYNDTKVKKGKQEKSDELTLTDKEWIRNQISKSKRFVNTDTGERRVVYQCKLSNSCSHISNNAPGFRYHLINKHLKHRRDFEEHGNNDSNEILETFSYITKNSSKNCCNDCSLKFKDQRAYQLHEKCHELFKIVASHSDSIFPSCNTCNQKFLNQDLLHHHLNKHDKNENLLEPIETGDIGAIRQQGKILNNYIQSYGETDLTDYTWKCGHCDNKNFLKEEHCNLHLLLVHTVSFVCPIDKMEFKGFKSVSLFIHHLRNKHSELFPNLSFNCTFCQMEFPTIYDKLNHMKNCDRKNLQCDHCDKRFWKKGDLLAHLKYVTGEIQYKCAVCDKKCISASDLKIHLRSHSKIKPYKCSLCTKSFRTLAARAAHVDAHNSNLMFSCEICKKSFKQRQLYRRHMKAHESR